MLDFNSWNVEFKKKLAEGSLAEGSFAEGSFAEGSIIEDNSIRSLDFISLC